MAQAPLEPGVPTARIAFRAPETLVNAVDELAARRGEDRSTWARRVLAEHVAAERGQHEEAVRASA
ncbi:MAG TPA: hypothetical protein VK988_14245 [Acidimicrobiales bacterium]|nr:hypothetical protein [Acidimicrobiales bacterium]